MGSQAGAPSLGGRLLRLGGFCGSQSWSAARHLPHAPPATAVWDALPCCFRAWGVRGPGLCPPRCSPEPRPHLGAAGGGTGGEPMGRARGEAQSRWLMGVGMGRAVRAAEPMEVCGAGLSGRGPMGWRAGALPRRCRRQVAAAPGAWQQPVRVRIPEAGERPGELRRVPELPERRERPRTAIPTEGRKPGRRGGRAAPAPAPGGDSGLAAIAGTGGSGEGPPVPGAVGLEGRGLRADAPREGLYPPSQVAGSG